MLLAPKPKNALVIIRLEDGRASEGRFSPSDQSIERQVHESQIAQWDTRKALAVSSLHKSEAPLSFIRSLIQRGNFSLAKDAIEELRSKSEQHEANTLALLKFEEVRIASFESQWQELIIKVSEALRLGAPPVTQLALFQMRANAYFEMGDFGRSSLDIEEAEQLSRLFPYAVSVLYARTLKVRLLARGRGVEAAQESLNWIVIERMKAGKLDLDLLLTILRVQIDLNRIAGKAYWKESIACFTLSDAIGDKLYSALAEFDYISSQVKTAEDLLKKTENLGLDYSKIAKIRNELQSLGNPSTSCLTIQAALGNGQASVLAKLLSENSFNQTVILLSELGIVADLEKNVVMTILARGKTAKAFEVLSRGTISKKDFFAEIWGRQVYSPRLHDTLISSLVHRLKKDCGVVVQVENGQVRARKTLVSI